MPIPIPVGIYSLKGFINFPILTNNEVGVVSSLGELSKDSLTYSKETGIYSNNLYSETVLYTFESKLAGVGNIPVPDAVVLASLKLGAVIGELSSSGTINEHGSSCLHTIEQAFITEFDNVLIGEMIPLLVSAVEGEEPGFLWMPEWVQYKLKEQTVTVKLWLSDNSFSEQYSGYEYEFISPIPNLNDFFKPMNQVLTTINNVTLAETVNNIEVARGGYPYTSIKTISRQWKDPENPINTIPTQWTTLVYGRAGTDPDKIRVELIKWILENSDHPENEWAVIFPELFKPNEFTLIPLFNQFAITNETIQDGITSPVISLTDALEAATLLCSGTGYAADVLLKNTCVSTTPYRSLAFLIVGSEDNIDGLSDFRDLFPEYVGLSPISADFARLSIRTQEWIHILISLIEAARTMTSISIVPVNIFRVIRDDIVYAMAEYEEFQYLMATQTSVNVKLGIVYP